MEPLSQIVGYPAIQIVLGSIPVILAIAGASRQNGRYLIAIEHRIDGLDKRIDKVDERLSRMETKLDRFSEAIHDLDKRLTLVEVTQNLSEKRLGR